MTTKSAVGFICGSPATSYFREKTGKFGSKGLVNSCVIELYVDFASEAHILMRLKIRTMKNSSVYDIIVVTVGGLRNCQEGTSLES